MTMQSQRVGNVMATRWQRHGHMMAMCVAMRGRRTGNVMATGWQRDDTHDMAHDNMIANAIDMDSQILAS